MASLFPELKLSFGFCGLLVSLVGVSLPLVNNYSSYVYDILFTEPSLISHSMLGSL